MVNGRRQEHRKRYFYKFVIVTDTFLDILVLLTETAFKYLCLYYVKKNKAFKLKFLFLLRIQDRNLCVGFDLVSGLIHFPAVIDAPPPGGDHIGLLFSGQ